MTQPDAIEQPSHYNFGMMEAREIIELAIADFTDPPTIYHTASALKYLLRASRKNGADDIAKARKHVVWAEAAARAYELRALRNIPPLHYNPDDVAFRHGDIEQVCGLDRDAGEPAKPRDKWHFAFAPAPDCSPGVSESRVHESTKSKKVGNVELVDSKPPMHAVALEMAEAAIPKRSGESAWSVTWPGESQTTSQPKPHMHTWRTLCGRSGQYETLVGN